MTGRRGFRIHPLDALFVLLAIFLAVAAYTFLFERQHVPRPVDPLLGAVLVVEFPVDRTWQADFPAKGGQVLVDGILVCDVVEVVPPDPAPGNRSLTRTVHLRILNRSGQRPEAMGLFRRGIRRGSRLLVSDRDSELEGEVIEVRPAAVAR
jgi:hypothetical protein